MFSHETFYITTHAVTIILHVISIGIYTLVGVKAWQRPTMEVNLKQTILLTCAFAVLLSVLFSVLQIEWMLSNHGDLVGTEIAYAWLFFEYLLAVYMISVGQIMNVIACWTRSSGPRVRGDTEPRESPPIPCHSGLIT